MSNFTAIAWQEHVIFDEMMMRMKMMMMMVMMMMTKSVV
jgi:hypothetical protein